MVSEKRREEKERRRERRSAARERVGLVAGERVIYVVLESDGGGVASELLMAEGAFFDNPTDEPGTMFTCEQCGGSVYVEGVLPSSTDVKDPSTFKVSLINGCLRCGSTMSGDQYAVKTESGVFMATHPFLIRTFLEVTLAELEAGQITPVEAVAKVAERAPALHPVVEWIERRGATLAIVVSVLASTLTFVDQRANDDSLTPEDVRRLVQIIDDEASERQRLSQQAASRPVYGPPTPPEVGSTPASSKDTG